MRPSMYFLLNPFLNTVAVCVCVAEIVVEMKLRKVLIDLIMILDRWCIHHSKRTKECNEPHAIRYNKHNTSNM